MNKLQRAQELLRLQSLAVKLIGESYEALIAALQDPSSEALVAEADRKVAELVMVQAEAKEKLNNWENND